MEVFWELKKLMHLKELVLGLAYNKITVNDTATVSTSIVKSDLYTRSFPNSPIWSVLSTKFFSFLIKKYHILILGIDLLFLIGTE